MRRSKISSTEEYVAYHSVRRMGRGYRPTKWVVFYSGKSRSFLEQAIGKRVWILVGNDHGSQTTFDLAGTYVPSKVEKEGDHFLISGKGNPLSAKIDVTMLSPFKRLFKEQRNFSFGFNKIRDPSIIREFESLLYKNANAPASRPEKPPLFERLDGTLRRVISNRYERNPQARKQCIAYHGCTCAVCGFDFEAFYGKRGKGVIHVHHLEPLSKIGKAHRVNPITDLRPICPNCHIMVHLGNKTIDLADLKKSIKSRHG